MTIRLLLAGILASIPVLILASLSASAEEDKPLLHLTLRSRIKAEGDR